MRQAEEEHRSVNLSLGLDRARGVENENKDDRPPHGDINHQLLRDP